MPKITEFDLQRAFCIWLDGNPDRNGVPRVQPALAPGVVYWHTPNGGERRDGFEGMRLNQIGLKAGVHDLLFLRRTRFTEGEFGLLFGIEWKKPDAKRVPLNRRSDQGRAAREHMIASGLVPERLADVLSDSQLDMHPRLMAAGMAASCVVDNLQDAKDFCCRYLLTNCN